MIPRPYRLKLKKDFQALKKYPPLHLSPLFSLQWRRNPASSTARIGFIVTKRTAKKAVTRNQMRRLLQAALYPLLPQLPKEVDIVIIAKHKLEDATYKDVEGEIKRVFQKIHLYRP